MDEKALFKLSYGLYLLTAREDGRDNGCIINTLTQVTNTPNRLCLAVNKDSLTHDMIARTGLFAASVLSQDASFALFQRFGLQSGRDADKFADFSGAARTEAGLLYLTECANALVAGKVRDRADLGTHTLFTADLTEARILSQVPSLTYEDYHQKVKPQPQASKTAGWRCRVCGYVYEGETLPPDFICPWCKHGAADFERIG